MDRSLAVFDVALVPRSRGTTQRTISMNVGMAGTVKTSPSGVPTRGVTCVFPTVEDGRCELSSSRVRWQPSGNGAPRRAAGILGCAPGRRDRAQHPGFVLSWAPRPAPGAVLREAVSYTHLRAHETRHELV